MTSFAVVREVRRIYGERRVGHAGTLDPNATGLLPVCLGQATRLVDYLHQQPKRYHCAVRLGERSETLDTEGTIEPGTDASQLDTGRVEAALAHFVGAVEQIPPMHSAVRSGGRHLYELARQGIEVERQPRTVHIHNARLLELRPGPVAEAEIEVTCSKGTYMRVLAADLGEALGTGGLLAWLERTGYGPLSLADAVSLDQLRAMPDPAAALRPLDLAVAHLTRIDLAPPLATQVRRGQSVFIPRLGETPPQGVCRVHAASGEVIAVGELQGTLLRPVKVLTMGGG
jgi:tRNA pseudouridine55 synthase